MLRDDQGRVVGKFGLSQSGKWLPVAEGERYPDECLLPAQVWRDKPGAVAVGDFVDGR